PVPGEQDEGHIAPGLLSCEPFAINDKGASQSAQVLRPFWRSTHQLASPVVGSEDLALKNEDAPLSIGLLTDPVGAKRQEALQLRQRGSFHDTRLIGQGQHRFRLGCEAGGEYLLLLPSSTWSGKRESKGTPKGREVG